MPSSSPCGGGRYSRLRGDWRVVDRDGSPHYRSAYGADRRGHWDSVSQTKHRSRPDDHLAVCLRCALDVEGRCTGETASPPLKHHRQTPRRPSWWPPWGTSRVGRTPPCPCREDSVARLTESLYPDAALLVGDIQYECGEHVDYQNFFDHFLGLPEAHLAPSRWTTTSTRSMTSRTSRAWASARAHRATGTTSPRRPPHSTRSVASPVRATTVSTWALGTSLPCGVAIEDCEAGSPQEQWLRADLASHPASCTLAHIHAPRFTSGRASDQAKLHPLWNALYDYEADLVVAGHDHHYERFIPMDPRDTRTASGGCAHLWSGRVASAISSCQRPGAPGAKSPTPTRSASYGWSFVREVCVGVCPRGRE